RRHLKSEKMQDLVEAHGNLLHEDAMRLISDTELRLVLLYENAYSSSIVPLKLYNYLSMNGPILAIGPERGRMASIISDTRMGVVFSPARGADAIHAQLHLYYQA